METIDINNFNDIFFSPVKQKYSGNKSYKESIPQYKQLATSLTRMSGMSLYIFDYIEKKFVYISENNKITCGYSVDEIESMGVDFFRIILYGDDMETFTKINDFGLNLFFNKLELSERCNYWASYDLRVVTKENEIHLYNFRFSPLVVDADGNLVLAMVQVDASTNKKPGNFLIYSINEHKFFEYNFEKDRLIPLKQRLLNNNEKKVLNLLARGLTINKVGNELSFDSNTMDYYNRSIISKLKVLNMKEAVFLYAKRGNFL